MDIFEYKHIQEAIKNVDNDLEYKKKCCIIFDPGLGKSAVATKEIIDFKEKNIIYLAPFKTIFDQIKNHLKDMGYSLEHDFKNIHFYTYHKVHNMIKRGKVINADFIISDEFHRIGKKKYYQSFLKFLKQNPNSYHLGLTATPILQWEYETLYFEDGKQIKKRVNMAELLFDNNVSHCYLESEAIKDGILEPYIYHIYYYLKDDSLKTAKSLLEKKGINDYRDYDVESLASYLMETASLEVILKKEIELYNQKILYFCRDYKHLLKIEELLKKIFPNISIYKLSHHLDKNINNQNLKYFSREMVANSPSKIMLSIHKLDEGYHPDDIDTIILGSKTLSYRLYTQRKGRASSLGNTKPIKIVDLEGNIERISSLQYPKTKFENKNKKSSFSKNIKVGGNILDLDSLLYLISKHLYVSKKEKTDIYYERIISNKLLKNKEEKFRDGTLVIDWYKEMLQIASQELHLLKENSEYFISNENMYIIETLAYIENFLLQPKALSEEEKRKTYYDKAIQAGDYLPKDEKFRFMDGSYMAAWYHQKKRQVKTIVKKIENNPNYILSDNEISLLLYFKKLHKDLKKAFINRTLAYGQKIRDGENYKKMNFFCECTDKDSSLLKNKSICQKVSEFRALQEILNNQEQKTKSIADLNYPFANIDILSDGIQYKR